MGVDEVFDIIKKYPGIRTKEISKHTGLNQTTISNNLKVLLKRKEIIRKYVKMSTGFNTCEYYAKEGE